MHRCDHYNVNKSVQHGKEDHRHCFSCLLFHAPWISIRPELLSHILVCSFPCNPLWGCIGPVLEALQHLFRSVFLVELVRFRRAGHFKENRKFTTRIISKKRTSS